MGIQPGNSDDDDEFNLTADLYEYSAFRLIDSGM